MRGGARARSQFAPREPVWREVGKVNLPEAQRVSRGPRLALICFLNPQKLLEPPPKFLSESLACPYDAQRTQMAPRKRPETQKLFEMVVRPKSKRSRSPRELEPEAKQRRVKRPGIAHTCSFHDLVTLEGSYQTPRPEWGNEWVYQGTPPTNLGCFRLFSLQVLGTL